MVRALFLVEKQAAELSVAQRPDLRQSQSVPVLADPAAEAPQPEGAALAQYTLGRGSELRSGTMDGAERLLLDGLCPSTTTSVSGK